jgi:AraC family transcriptional regulator, exoenzyme S synthesis regulatory protein ExsA
MLRVPSEIQAEQFEFLKIQDTTFVAFRSDVYPSKNDVFFEENALIYVLEGEKIFSNKFHDVKVRKGDVLFIKRGFYLMSESIDKDYKSLVFFFEERILKDFVNQNLHAFKNVSSKPSPYAENLLRLETNEVFEKFIESLKPYFTAKTGYLNQFLKLKVQELLLHLLELDTSKELQNLLFQIFKGQKVDLEHVLAEFFLKPLSIEEIAKISGRSLSAFKREFAMLYEKPPGIWLKEKKLEHAAFLLKNKLSNVGQVAEEVGYESVPHFIKSFKEKYGCTPKKYLG